MDERLKLIINYLGISVYAFSKSIDTSQQSMSYYLKGRPVSADTIQKIVKKYPEIDSYWLLTGEGEMLKSGENVQNNMINSLYGLQLNSNGNKKINYSVSGATISEIVKNYQNTIETLQKQISERDTLVNKLMDKLINI